jgi:acetoacetyl-CoA reductase/3-oxoacyl-[acyl-carrier protein] reductase
MSGNFDGRLAIVTGGCRGIGQAIARQLAQAGAKVHVFDREAARDEAYPSIAVHAVDVADSAGVSRAVQGLPEPALLLVNNAGITRDRRIVNMSDDEWSAVIGVNLTGAFNMIRAVAPGMTAAGYGRIVNVASINGLRGKFGQANYTAAKAGMIGLTKTAARELGPKGITVNVIAPGMVTTAMSLAAPEEIRARALAETVIGRLAEPDDIAAAALFLLSDGARCVTGEVLRVDGGQYI